MWLPRVLLQPARPPPALLTSLSRSRGGAPRGPVLRAAKVLQVRARCLLPGLLRFWGPSHTQCVTLSLSHSVSAPLATPIPARRSSIELQRLESVSRSPVYALFSESLAGLDTLRAFGLQDRCARKGE